MVSPVIGVVIPSYNDKLFLERLFDSLYDVRPGAPFWPVIVDDQSNDGTERWIANNIRSYASAIRTGEKSYFTRSCNMGIDYCRRELHSPWYLLLNSDVTVTDNWASALLTTAKSLHAAVVGATLLNPDSTVQHVGAYGQGAHFHIDKPWTVRHSDRIVPWVTGAAMMIGNPVIDLVGLLPTKDMTQYDASDREFCGAARLRGFEVAVSAGCILYHYTHESRQARGV